MSVYRCPSCQSENTSLLSLVHDQGITRSKGTAWVGRDVGLYHLKSQSKASRAAAPPSKGGEDLDLIIAIGEVFKKSWWVMFIWIWFMFGGNSPNNSLLAAFSYFFPPLKILYYAVPAYYVWKIIIELRKNVGASRRSTNTYAERLNRWNSSYQCLRCSNIFEIK
jgi:DNA-directed RNA polymerase subunit RPC12/RpoP